jgi:hypothetical protein
MIFAERHELSEQEIKRQKTLSVENQTSVVCIYRKNFDRTGIFQAP